MKKFIIPLLTIAVVFTVVFAGCVPAAAPEVTPPPVTPPPVTPPPVTPPVTPPPAGPTIPSEPPGFPQPNPYWGLGFKPDGTAYQFAVMPITLGVPYYKVISDVLETQLKMSGAEVDVFNADWVLDTQIAQIEDLITRGADAIAIVAVDPSGVVPAVDKATQAGIAVFANEVEMRSENVISTCVADNYVKGQLAGQAMVNAAEAMNKKLYVYELWCPMEFEICQDRTKGFHAVVDGNPLIEVVPGPATYWDEEVISALTDAFPAHPELNALYVNAVGDDATVTSLKTLNRYYPIGNPGHVVCVLQDGSPTVLEQLRLGYFDGAPSNSPWAGSDITAKVLLTYVCLGQPVPKKVVKPVEIITPENVGISPFGAPMRWGDMLGAEPDITQWPILDMAPYGITTPTYK
jgi:ribose transport system substrate-binding protein